MTAGHDHRHHRHHGPGPLESITHVRGGAMVLDIGGSVGALHVLLDDAWVGQEVFLAAADPTFAAHAGVWRRGDGAATALFASLEAGRYDVLGREGAAMATVDVCGGELTELDLLRSG